ncbi:hypothetical protein BABINDRAFT_174625 [Babjeviella inositovora NRRL Y-12698]|uniref:DUF155 domain-containing protein n=1 Tax=Babjeviella inositovora NRRL Y-12698 TaxID=984486 RepID=A0A1E3QX01_9ASCO|nr:uncharacterized protein BABINDRAFT_174625 [Babjeviella inositovora NRRL Y-12698]ODQ82044.1 hypothetical protein BABINDRAFT_174625 [Babjeviella inositovora NRRL Y-12698]
MSETSPLLPAGAETPVPGLISPNGATPVSATPNGVTPPKPKKLLGPQRTSRTTQKLRLLPDDPIDVGEESGRDVYSQVTRIKDTPARKDAETLSKSHRDLLPRVTAYCTAGTYKMKDLIRWLKDRKRVHNTSPKLFDECLYTPFAYKDWRGSNPGSRKSSTNRRTSDSPSRRTVSPVRDRVASPGIDEQTQPVVMRLADEGGDIDVTSKRSDLFIFEYGVVVMWGFSVREEQSFLEDLAKFESEKLAEEDIQVEEFNYYITRSYQPRIYNDFITLRDDNNYMLKLSVSHAISQSVKISLFEELVDNTIEDTQDIPLQIANTGKVEMNRDEIMKSIGELFILRININLHGSVLDSPELMWAEPHLEPIYQATRGYLEINQRVELLNQRLEVISDLLQMLKEQLGHSHEEYLEFVVIVLVSVEVFVSVVNIIIDIAGAA